MSEHDALCWLYLWLLFCGGSDDELATVNKSIQRLTERERAAAMAGIIGD